MQLFKQTDQVKILTWLLLDRWWSISQWEEQYREVVKTGLEPNFPVSHPAYDTY